MTCRLLSVLVAFLSLGWGQLHAQGGEIEEYMSRGRALSKADKIDQALPYFLLSLELAETRLGADDPAVIPIIEELAGAHAAREDYLDAEPLYERALHIQEREANRYQSGIVRTLNNLGHIYEATERSDRALALYRQVLAIWAPVLGGDHPDVQTAGRRLAKLVLGAPAAAAPREAPPLEPPKTEPPGAKPLKAAVPRPKPEPAAAPAPPESGPGYAIHLTSIRNSRDAPAEWDRLRRLYGLLLDDLELRVAKADLGPPRGIYHRIKGASLSRDAARARCAAFAARGVWCAVTRLGAAADRPMIAGRGAAPIPTPPSIAERGIAAAKGYRVHLTSIRNPQDADAEWRRLKRVYGSLLDGLGLAVARVDLGAARGIYYRIKGGPLTGAAARALCAQFTARKVWCRVARPGEEAVENTQRLALQKVRRRPPSRHRGTRRRRDAVSLRVRRRDRGCRRSPFSWPFAPVSFGS